MTLRGVYMGTIPYLLTLSAGLPQTQHPTRGNDAHVRSEHARCAECSWQPRLREPTAGNDQNQPESQQEHGRSDGRHQTPVTETPMSLSGLAVSETGRRERACAAWSCRHEVQGEAKQIHGAKAARRPLQQGGAGSNREGTEGTF